MPELALLQIAGIPAAPACHTAAASTTVNVSFLGRAHVAAGDLGRAGGAGLPE